jgi:hypothetical protein
MPKYDASIMLSVEVDAEDSDGADRLICIELVDRLLQTALSDNKFKMWIDILQIEEQ